jgi:hypothetical protein
MPALDIGTILLLLVVLLIAVTLAVLAGTGSARVFFEASRDSDEKKV